MSKKRHRQGRIVKVQHTNVREMEVGHNPGEHSPYWDWLDAVVAAKHKDGHDPIEPALANPDMLSEESSWTGQSSDPEAVLVRKESNQEFERTLIRCLSDREYRVVHLLTEGKTQEYVARKLKISRNAVMSYLARARKKITRAANNEGDIRV